MSHVTQGTTFKVKRSKVKVTRPLYSPPCWRVRQLQWWAWERVGRRKLLLLAVCSAARGASAPTGEEGAGAYRHVLPPTACYYYFSAQGISDTEGEETRN